MCLSVVLLSPFSASLEMIVHINISTVQWEAPLIRTPSQFLPSQIPPKSGWIRDRGPTVFGIAKSVQNNELFQGVLKVIACCFSVS